MTPEEAYEEALRRIREAEETGALELDLSGKKWEADAWKSTGLEALTRLPQELERLTSLQSLDLSRCKQLSGDLSPLMGLTSLQSLNLSWCDQTRGDLSPLSSLTSLQSLNLSGFKQIRGDLSPLASLTSLQSLNLSNCYQLSDFSLLARLTLLQSLDLSWCHFSALSPLAGLTSLQTLDLAKCKQFSDLSPLASITSLQKLHLSECGIRRFAPLASLLPTLKELSLFHCKLDDLPPKICGEEYNQNVLDKVRAHYGLKPPKVFVSYAWGDITPTASEEDRQRLQVVEKLCRMLEQEYWQVVRDKTALDYGDQISGFMKTLGAARLVIVVLSEKYLRSPYCMTELYSIYQNARQESQKFLNRIIPLVLADARIGTWRGRATYAKHWEAEFKAMEQDIPHLGEEDLKLYKAMRRWHNEVGDMLAYVNDVLSPHGFDEIVKDDFAGLRQMLERRR
jgi:Leucine-rich repeat (LRR) protein